MSTVSHPSGVTAATTGSRAARVAAPGAGFEIVELERQAPGPGQVRVAVEACGVCRTDLAFVEGDLPGLRFPLVPGHEIAGRVEAVGERVEGWAVGDRVAVGWCGGTCGHCVPCRDGDLIHCDAIAIPGLAYPGGYAEAVVVPASGLARIPDGLDAAAAAPMGCAGVATFGALRRCAARAGDLVAVLGLGGLGHLAVQFANRLGFETVAVVRRPDQAEAAAALGVDHCVDASAHDVADALQALGGAAAILATAGSSEAMGASVGGLRRNGELVVIGVDPEPIRVSPFDLVATSRTVHGHPSGTPREVEETMRFAARTGVRTLTETYPLADVSEAFERMRSGAARHRAVLTMGSHA